MESASIHVRAELESEGSRVVCYFGDQHAFSFISSTRCDAADVIHDCAKVPLTASPIFDQLGRSF